MRKKTIQVTLVALTLIFAQSAIASTTLRLSTLYKPGSPGAQAADQFAQEVEEKTNGNVKITVYPASQLGDWVQVTASVMQGSVDMALQPFASSFNKHLAIGWFPYVAPTLEDAKKAFSPGGLVFNIVDGIISEQNLTLVGVWGAGMGGAGFNANVADITDPKADHNLKVRVWPGGLTHQVLMKKLGYNPTSVPWSDLYTSLQTGVVDGQVGGTPRMTLESFKDVTKTWIQLNDHFEPGWLFINQARLKSLSEADQKVIKQAASDMTKHRFKTLKVAQQNDLDTMRAAGIKVITLTPDQLAAFVKVTREEVWPEIEDQVGPKIMKEIKANIKSP